MTTKTLADYAPFERVHQTITITSDGEQFDIDVIVCVDDFDEGSEPLYGGPREDWDEGVPPEIVFSVFYPDGESAEHLAGLVDEDALYFDYIAQHKEAHRP